METKEKITKIVTPVLQTRNLTKYFGTRKCLDNVSITVEEGDIYGLIGKNGAGKTTFMKACLGMIKPTSGETFFWGAQNCSNKNNIGTLIEYPSFIGNKSARANLELFSEIYGGKENIDEILNIVGLADTGKKKAKKFSLGMKQRLGIAIALLNNPKLLILDEPINGLDPTGIREIRDLILHLNREKNVTFIISSHLLDELGKVATKFGFIDNGVLIEEVTAEELKAKCTYKIVIETDDNKKTIDMLSEYVDGEKIKEIESYVVVNDSELKTRKINKILVENGIGVDSIYYKEQSLEDYFIKKVG
ncbi:ATP-binding cassette domain-containing protein [Lachnobacterium bovis]|uniref:ATP-binding cassette domain-containing protein n=1 Tax=Lachnobacterium bovis TaxID=140626 RepID=UPI0006919838|nr:ATP-binding cassette domain-containing protein [Lachnobacterium bovis]